MAFFFYCSPSLRTRSNIKRERNLIQSLNLFRINLKGSPKETQRHEPAVWARHLHADVPCWELPPARSLTATETFLVNSRVSNSCCVDLNCYFYTRFGDRPGLNNALYNQKFSTLLTSQSYFNRLAYSTSVVSNCRETPSDLNFFPWKMTSLPKKHLLIKHYSL